MSPGSHEQTILMEESVSPTCTDGESESANGRRDCLHVVRFCPPRLEGTAWQAHEDLPLNDPVVPMEKKVQAVWMLSEGEENVSSIVNVNKSSNIS